MNVYFFASEFGSNAYGNLSHSGVGTHMLKTAKKAAAIMDCVFTEKRG